MTFCYTRYPPISVRIHDGARGALELRDLARSPAVVRRDVKSLVVSVNPEPVLGRSAQFDILNDFLLNYPNLRALDLSGFDLLVCAPSNSAASPTELTPDAYAGTAPVPLRSLVLDSSSGFLHSSQALLGPLQLTPDLSRLEVRGVAFDPSDEPESLPRLPFSLNEYWYWYDGQNESCTSRAWTVPLKSRAHRNAPMSKLVIDFDYQRHFDELTDADVDLSFVHRLSLVIRSPPSVIDYGVVVARCTNLRHLGFCMFKNAVVPGPLPPLFSSLVGPLASLSVFVDVDDAASLSAIDKAFSELLAQAHGPLRGLRFFQIGGLAPGTRNFPLLATWCRSHRIRFVKE